MLNPVTALVFAAAGPGNFRPALRRLGERKAGHPAGPRSSGGNPPRAEVRQDVAAGVRERSLARAGQAPRSARLAGAGSAAQPDLGRDPAARTASPSGSQGLKPPGPRISCISGFPRSDSW